jgi:activator of 2-hydroxyglutaryl-CoA dehydratase
MLKYATKRFFKKNSLFLVGGCCSNKAVVHLQGGRTGVSVRGGGGGGRVGVR